MAETTPCQNCGLKVDNTHKYCASCGFPVRAIQIIADAPKTAEVCFVVGRSPRSKQAKDYCKRKELELIEENGANTVLIPLSDIETLVHLFELVDGLKDTGLTIDGKSASKKDLIFHEMNCYRKRQGAGRGKEIYCLGNEKSDIEKANLWGCHRLNMPLNGDWLAWGRFEGETWHFDKEKIRKELERKIKENHLCPALTYKNVMAALERLPDSINPKYSDMWNYVWEDLRGVPFAYKVKLNLNMAHELLGEDAPKPKWQDFISYLIESRVSYLDAEFDSVFQPTMTEARHLALKWWSQYIERTAQDSTIKITHQQVVANLSKALSLVSTPEVFDAYLSEEMAAALIEAASYIQRQRPKGNLQHTKLIESNS